VQDAPILRGLRLGMSADEVRTALKVPLELTDKTSVGVYFYWNPKTQTEQPKGGYVFVGEKETTVNVNAELIKANESLVGVESIHMQFYDDALYDYFISYDPKSYKFKMIQPLATSLSTLYKLPERSWDFFSNSAAMKCDGFRVLATMGVSKIPEFSKAKPPQKISDLKSLPVIKKSIILISLTDYVIEDRLKERAAAALKESDEEKARRDAEKRFRP